MRSFALTPLVVLLAGCPLLSEDDLVRRYDMDADGHDALHFGGDDCDDDVATSFGDDDGDGYSACGADQRDPDCDDKNADVSPGAIEIGCNGVDDDCNGFLDLDDDNADTSPFTWYVDGDGDGYGAGAASQPPSCEPPTPDSVNNNGDCDDVQATINPETIWYYDNDGDGYGASDSKTIVSCARPDEVWSLKNTDCHDDPQDGKDIHPEATEVCNGIDDDCDTILMADEADLDGDGFDVCKEGDCDDDDPDAYPGAPEVWYDGADQDCRDKNVDEDDFDQDGDKFAADQYGGDDCDDLDPDKRPPYENELAKAGSAWDPVSGELWYDAFDNNCDGNLNDRDGDGVAGPSGAGPLDCDDTNKLLAHGATLVLGSAWTTTELEDLLFPDCRDLTVVFPSTTRTLTSSTVLVEQRGTRFQGAGPGVTVINGLVFSLREGPGSPTQLVGLTLGSNNIAPAILVARNSSAIVDNVALVNNVQSGSHAPAMSVGGQVTATDLTVSGNSVGSASTSADTAGAIRVDGGTLTVDGGVIADNSAFAVGCGPGSTVEFNGVDFERNTRGVAALNECALTVTNATMLDNGVAAEKSTFEVELGSASTLSVVDSWIVGSASDASVFGGLGAVDLLLERDVIALSETRGAAVAPQGASDLTVRNVAFLSNASSLAPAAISLSGLTGTRSVVVENTAFVDSAGYTTVTPTASTPAIAAFGGTFIGSPTLGGLAAFNIATGDVAVSSPAFTPVTSFVAGDPMFVSYSPTADWDTWDLHLQAASPLRDAGVGPSGTDIGLYPNAP